MSTHRIVDVRPEDEWSQRAEVTVVQIGEDWIPDYEPGPLDRSLIKVQHAMFDEQEQDLDNVRDCIDWPPIASRKEIGLPGHGKGTTSDVAMAAIILHHQSPFAIQYRWAPGAHPVWPEGLTLVFWRGVVYERTGDTMKRWVI